MAKRNSRKSDLAMIHIAKKDLAMEDEDYRALLLRITAKDSTADMDIGERGKVLSELKRLGWQPKRKAYVRGHQYKKPTSRKIIVLWKQLAEAGKVNCDKLDCMGTWLLKVMKKRNPDWFTAAEASQVIEMMKEWLERE